MLHSHTQFVYATDVARARARSLTHTTKTKEKSINRAWNPVELSTASCRERRKFTQGPRPLPSPLSRPTCPVTPVTVCVACWYATPRAQLGRNANGVTVHGHARTICPDDIVRGPIHVPYTQMNNSPPPRAGIGHVSMSHELKEPLLCLERQSSPSRTFSYSRSSLHQTRSSHSMEWKRGGR